MSAVRGRWSLTEQRPDIALDWDYSKNDGTPDDVPYGCGKRVHWRCHICGHEWVATINSRTANHTTTGCRVCSNDLRLSKYKDTMKRRIDKPLTLNCELANLLDSVPTNYMKCPHCGCEWYEDPDVLDLGEPIICPNCN